MNPASTNAQGQCTSMRDVCVTPPPSLEGENQDVVAEPENVPYCNIADNRMTLPHTASNRVRIENMLSSINRTVILRSHGDEAGENGGVASHSVGAGARYVVGCSRIFFEGSRVVFHGSATDNNGEANSNAPVGTQSSPSQSKVFVSP